MSTCCSLRGSVCAFFMAFKMSTSMKVLVYWPKETLWSVVSESAIRLRGPEISPGAYAETKFQGKYYSSLIIAKADSIVIKKVEDDFRSFMSTCVVEEAQEDIENRIVQYIHGALKEKLTEPRGKDKNQNQEDETEDPEDEAVPKRKGRKRKLQMTVGLPSMSSDDDSDRDVDFVLPKEHENSYSLRDESSADEQVAEKHQRVRKMKKKVQTMTQEVEETNEAKLAKQDEAKIKKIREKEVSLAVAGKSIEILNEMEKNNSVSAKLEELTAATNINIQKQEELMKKLDVFLTMHQCKECIKSMYRDLKNKPDTESARSSMQTPSSKKNKPDTESAGSSMQTPSSKKNKPDTESAGSSMQTPSSKNPDQLVNICTPAEMVEGQDTSECCNNNGEELVYLGEARFGIKMQKGQLLSCEENSTSPEKFVLNLIEYLITREECKNMTVYGHGKEKVSMDFNLRRAIRSHVFNLFKEKFSGKSEEERNKFWLDTLVYKINDKIRGIRNGKYKSKKQNA